MKVPRFGIGWIMVFVAIAALDSGILRASYHRTGPRNIPTPVNTRNKIELWARGALPMANILAIGLLVGLRRPGNHPSLLGFEAFGAAALVLYAVAVNYACERHYLQYSDFVPGIIRKNHAACQVASSVMLVLPQLAFALLGGFLTRKFWSADPRRSRAVQHAPDDVG